MIARYLLPAVLALGSIDADACSPPPPDTRTRADIAAAVHAQYDRAKDLVEVRITRTATPRRSGSAIILQSMKNVAAVGRTIRVGTMDLVSCGYGDAIKGTTHWLYLDNPTAAHFAPISRDVIAILAALGISLPQ